MRTQSRRVFSEHKTNSLELPRTMAIRITALLIPKSGNEIRHGQVASINRISSCLHQLGIECEQSPKRTKRSSRTVQLRYREGPHRTLTRFPHVTMHRRVKNGQAEITLFHFLIHPCELIQVGNRQPNRDHIATGRTHAAGLALSLEPNREAHSERNAGNEARTQSPGPPGWGTETHLSHADAYFGGVAGSAGLGTG